MSQMVRRRIVRGTAGEFHHRPVESGEWTGNEVWVHELVQPALVLGSSQRPSIVDLDAAAAAGVEVVRRRSGGGAVWLAPGEVTWVDVIIRPGMPGWGSDVHTPMRHVGDAFGARLRGLVAGAGDPGAADPGAADPGAVVVHRGPMTVTTWSSLVCFDGVGPGEVSVGGRKLLGISQRRTRDWARVQCCWYHRYDSGDLVRWLRPDALDALPCSGDLAPPGTVPEAWSPALVDAIAAAFGEGPPTQDQPLEGVPATTEGGDAGG